MTAPYVRSPFKRDLVIPGDRSGRYQVVPHPLASGDFWIERILNTPTPPRTAADVTATGVRSQILEYLRRKQSWEANIGPDTTVPQLPSPWQM